MKRWIIVLMVVILTMGLTGMAWAEKAYTPSTNAEFNLGSDKLKYKDLKISGDMYIEGTDDAYETKITATDATADRTVTLQDASGTVSYTTDAFVGTLADTQLIVGQSTGLGAAKAMSGDATITNAGVITIGANKVNAGKIITNAVTLLVAAGTTTNSVTVDSGHFFTGAFLTTIGGINGLNLVNDPAYSAGVWTISMVNAVSADAVWTLNFISDN